MRLPALLLSIQMAANVTNTAAAAAHHVRADATGADDGSDWDNAYRSLPSALNRGDTYYVADGSYSGRTFDDPQSADVVITVKKATADDHGTETGWQESYGDGQAIIANGMTFTTGHYVIDGNGTHTVPSDTPEDYGFKVSADSSTDNAGIIAFGTSGNTVTDITLRYLHVFNTTNGEINNATVGLRFYPGAVQDRIKVQNCFLENSGKDGIQISNSSQLLFERCYIKRYGKLEAGDPDVHGQTVQLFYGGDDIIFRWNTWEANEGQSLIAIAGIGNNTQRVRFYGNLVFNKSGETSAASGGFNTSGGIIGNAWSYNGHDGLFVYNNTVVNVGGAYGGHSHFPMSVAGAAGENEFGYNNLFYNCGGVGGATGWSAWDYHASGGGNTYGGADEQTGLASTIFVDYANNDFRLAAATNPGLALDGEAWWQEGPDSFFGQLDDAADVFGTMRGADGNWDRGAYERPGNDTNAPTIGVPTPSGVQACTPQ